MKYLIPILALCCLVSACAGPRPIAVDQTLLTDEDEQRLWRRAQEEQATINGSGLLYQDPEIENYLARLAQKLGKNSNSPPMSFRIRVIRDSELNAFAFPDGAIYIHTGILARMENEAQLAALLAHEMAHCIQRHSFKALASIRNRPTYLDAVGPTASDNATENKPGRLPIITGSIAVSSGYTRELETEADQIGLDLVAKANYDPWETVRLFELLKDEMNLEGIEEPLFFGTHPNVQQRIENINTRLRAKFQGNNPGIKNTEIFQSRMSRLMLDNAVLDLRRGRFLVARRTVEKYLEAKPHNARAYFLLGEIFRQRGRKDDAAAALNFYEKAISLNPAFAEPHKAVGLIHFKAGEKRLAKKFFQSCLLLSPDAADKAYVEEYLRLCITQGGG